jgi:hypothetical protein
MELKKMPVTNLPAIWSESYINSFEETLVFGSEGVVNRDYEGTAAMGGSVIIPDMRNLTVPILDYSVDTGMPAVSVTNHDTMTLLIDRYKAWQVFVSSIEAVQQNLPKLNILMAKGAQSMAKNIDSYIAGAYVNAGTALGDDAAPIPLTAANIYGFLVDISTEMTLKNVPADQRSVILPPEVVALLRTSDYIARRDEVVQGNGGAVGNVAGLTIRESNNVARNGANFKIMGVHPSGISLVEQLEEMIEFQPQEHFGRAIKSLHVYGMKVTRPESIVTLTGTIA